MIDHRFLSFSRSMNLRGVNIATHPSDVWFFEMFTGIWCSTCRVLLNTIPKVNDMSHIIIVSITIKLTPFGIIVKVLVLIWNILNLKKTINFLFQMNKFWYFKFWQYHRRPESAANERQDAENLCFGNYGNKLLFPKIKEKI